MFDDHVRRYVIAGRINRLHAMNRQRGPEYSEDYVAGYEDALADLFDILEGWCAPDLRIPEAACPTKPGD